MNETNRGIYKCLATNPIGMDERKFLVAIHVAPTIDSTGLAKTRHAIVGQTVTLECPARASPPPTRRWYYEGAEMYPRDTVKIVSSLNLQKTIKTFPPLAIHHQSRRLLDYQQRRPTPCRKL
jgi:hypothetical protein